MIDPGDSHEWLMYQAANNRRSPPQVMPPIYEPQANAPALPAKEKYRQPTKSSVRMTKKDWQNALRPVGVGRELYAEARRRRGKTGWAIAMQKRLNALVKGKPDPSLEQTLGYGADDLRCHLERQFHRGMNWENYAGFNRFKAKGTWVIDHIVPKRLFGEADAKQAFALHNLRPLWLSENMRKGGERLHLV